MIPRRALLALLVPPLPIEPALGRVAPDPIYAAIQAVSDAEARLTAVLNGLDESDADRMLAADEAADFSSNARNALSRTYPTTPAGFRALVEFHAFDVPWLEPDTFGALAVRDIAQAMNALLRARASPG